MLEPKLKKELNKLLDNLNIKKKNNLIIHSNSAGLLQYNKNKRKVFDLFWNVLKKRVGNEGTVVFPTYNYNILSNKKKNLSVSQVGLLTNFIIKKKEFIRTKNPVFSHAIFGKLKDELKTEDTNIAFGTKNSIFQKFIDNKFKIIGFCCPVNSITILHHLEVLARVDYRFKKIFNFKIGKKKFNYEYFVGKKKINYKLKENKIRSLLIKKKLIKITKLGRFECWSINSKNLSKTILQTLKKNSYFLIK
tara:strand:- start:165 stop:908 length:744 start_codon:yes stop_codon:yes gene_type:complete